MPDLVRASTFTLVPDPDGFLFRECPTCHRHFKLRVVDTISVSASGKATLNEVPPGEAASGYCPLCYEMVAHSDWRTDAQREYIRNLRVGEAMLDYSNAVMRIAHGSEALF